jgi:hypothetical protein
MGSLYGAVVDPNGAVIAGAKIKLFDKDGNEDQSLITDNAGNYQIDGLESRDYKIEISVDGFRTFQREFTVTKGGRRKMNALLEIGFSSGGMMIGREYKMPLADAVSQQDLDTVKELISKGENVNQREDDRTTPLFVAVENGNIEILETLLNFGAKVNARNKEKQTPLMQVDEDASSQLVDLLVRFGAKVDLVDNDGNTALIKAADSASADVVKALIDAGADVNLINKEGKSALMNAADDDDIDKVHVLLLAGAKVNLRDKEGESAWDLTSDVDIESLLVSFGAEAGRPELAAPSSETIPTQSVEPVQESPSPQEVPID